MWFGECTTDVTNEADIDVTTAVRVVAAAATAAAAAE